MSSSALIRGASRWGQRAVGLVLLTCAAGLVVAYAQPTGNFGVPPRLIPYEGHLDKDGAPVTTPEGMGLDMVFYLVDAPSKTRAAALWFEEHRNVPVVAGRFSVALGRSSVLPDELLRRPELYLGVVVAGAELGGRQRILSAPGAITAGQTGDLTVHGALAVAGPASIAGRTNITGPTTILGTTTITGDLLVSGSVQNQQVLLNVFRKPGNNGTVSCNVFCAGEQFAGISGTCVGARIVAGGSTGRYVACTDAPGLGNDLMCWCARP